MMVEFVAAVVVVVIVCKEGDDAKEVITGEDVWPGVVDGFCVGKKGIVGTKKGESEKEDEEGGKELKISTPSCRSVSFSVCFSFSFCLSVLCCFSWLEQRFSSGPWLSSLIAIALPIPLVTS